MTITIAITTTMTVCVVWTSLAPPLEDAAKQPAAAQADSDNYS